VIYTTLTIPVLGLLLFLMITRLPMVLGRLWAGLEKQAAMVASSQSHGDWLAVAASALQMLVLALLGLGITYVAYNLVRRPLVALWNWLRAGRPRAADAV
jgi:hypothetical protein